MKKKFLLIVSFVLVTKLCFSSPTNTVSIPNSFSPNTVISSSQVNANFNEGQTKFNAHSHSDISQLGTITTGTWQGTVIDEAYGGLGSDFSATAQGNIFYFSGTGTVATLAPGTTDYPLVSNGSGANPAYEQLATAGIANLAVTNAKIAASTIDLTAKVTGTLPAGNGGTGVTIINKGTTGALTDNVAKTVTFATPFSDTNYTVIFTGLSNDASAQAWKIKSKATTSFVVQCQNANMDNGEYIAFGS